MSGEQGGEFVGLVAVVTGGASGIGAAIVERLAAEGARVAILDLNPSVEADSSTRLSVRANVADDVSVRAAIAAVVERFGRLDIVVNNAGIGAQGSIEDNDDDEWHRVFDINVVGMARVTRAALPHLREGVRVNCDSPGTADTPWVGRLLDSAADPVAERAALEARQPHGRLVAADEVAGAVAYLASPRSGSTTGTSVAVDGGMQELRLRPQ
ncbi:MAG TPA: SDR family oxidoreductase [Plantibacter sp.]|uniref:SDR family NAD(P)-dependent oxidoreductase n=1 Tax=Plantibacter sp. TaxID=1871045 RepID=UPI002B89CA1E|nr:SDR family oxidoreductase [Plantibacter sp.]